MNSQQMYEVFFNDRIVILRESDNLLPIDDYDQVIKLEQLNDLQNHVKNFLENNEIKGLALIWSRLDELFKEFVNLFKFLKAAGGLVVNEKNELLCIYRMEKWDLPKGKVERKERMEEGAIREVQEETGLKNVELLKLVGKTYHLYVSEYHSKIVFKQTNWYKMNASSSEALTPQLEEDISRVEWCTPDQVKSKVLSCTYHSLVPMFENYLSH